MGERVYVLDDPEAKGPISDEQIEALLTLDSITILAFNDNTDTIGIYDPDYFYQTLNLEYHLGISRYFNRTDFAERRNVAIQLNYSPTLQNTSSNDQVYEIISESNLNYFDIPESYHFAVNLSALDIAPDSILLRFGEAEDGSAIHHLLSSSGYRFLRPGPLAVLRDLGFGLVTHVYGSSTALLALLLYPLFFLALMRFMGTWEHEVLLHQVLGASVFRVFLYHIREFTRLYLLTSPLILVSILYLAWIYLSNQTIVSSVHVFWLVIFHVIFVFISYSLALMRVIYMAGRR